MDNGQDKSTNRLLVFLPHDRSHGTERIPENLWMLFNAAAAEGSENEVNQTSMALIAKSIGGTIGIKFENMDTPHHVTCSSDFM